MSDSKNIDIPPDPVLVGSDTPDTNVAAIYSEGTGSARTTKTSTRVSASSERQIKFERAQKCLENAALVSKRIKEHRKATAELLGRPFEEDDGGDTASEMASTMSERTGYSVATDTSTTMSVQEALNIPGISESLANTLKQKELLMERIKQYKEISKRPVSKPVVRRDSTAETKNELKRSADNNEHLVNAIKEKEISLNVLQDKLKEMETIILDLQEKINEKDQIIEAKNKATTLMSDSLSKKEKDSLALLEDTRQHMSKMQENFINMEMEWKEEKQRLIVDIESKNEKVKNLEEANFILENARFEISVAHSKIIEEQQAKNKEILKLEKIIAELSQHTEKAQEKEHIEEEKGSQEIADMVELTKKVEFLEQLNCQIRLTNKELESKLATLSKETKSPASSSPSKKASPLPTRKGGRNTSSKMKSPWSQLSTESLPLEIDKKSTKGLEKAEHSRLEVIVQALNKEILEKEYIISQKEAANAELRASVKETEPIESGIDMVDIGTSTDITDVKSDDKVEKTIEEPIVTSSDDYRNLGVTELLEKLILAQEQIKVLNSEIDAANKNMIKVKSTHKLKLKQLQKTIDNFSKLSDANTEIVKLNEELHQLSQKVAELEEEKGNLQLHLVDYDSGRLTESDIYKKLVEMENLAESRLKSISVLEAQKFDLVQELHNLQQKYTDMEDKLADMSHLQSEQVSSEIKSVQLEEQIDELTALKKELEIVVDNLKLDKDQLNGTITLLQDEKEELTNKLDNYIQENIELTEKLEKLSAEKVSSAESIEIVESLTTQEKLELEEYNKGLSEDKADNTIENLPSEKNIDTLIEQSAELNNKIELFTQERQEVMEKMSKIAVENESLHNNIEDLNYQCTDLQKNIDLCYKEKMELQKLNQELVQNIEELKRERVEIIKDTVEVPKPVPSMEESTEGLTTDSHDDKVTGEKGMNRTKSVKQLTKEILKLKNTIKEREAEIADSQMKILSLEEQQQKQNKLLQSYSYNENKIKLLIDENQLLKDEVDNLRKDKESEQQITQLKLSHDVLIQDMQRTHHEYAATLSTRDTRINELENILLEYEKQIFNYGNSLQQKDKDLNEYINQITKLNDVSQKLKSTIEILEEEKAKDQIPELVKSLNKQVAAYQKKLSEYEDKIRILEEEKTQVVSLKNGLENKNIDLESDIKHLQEKLGEKQELIKELQKQQQKHSEELKAVNSQTKERDEEIHEIKLQLRKESIENEKLRTNIAEKETSVDEIRLQLDDLKSKLDDLQQEKNTLKEQFDAAETKNKELMEKLKKFAISIKKKTAMYTELEAQLNETRKILENKNEQLEQLLIQVETLPALQEKLKHAEEEINRLQSLKVSLDQQKSENIKQHQTELMALQNQLTNTSQEILRQNESVNILNNDLQVSREENRELKTQIDGLNNKIVEREIELKNNMNLLTKISGLETDINQKQNQIAELLYKLEQHNQQEAQIHYGFDAKIQERDLYIENLESEVSKYKSRISRLEDSISSMEDRRHSLERDADQLGMQLQDKQKAYSEYTSQEDELIKRLAILMDHDRVVEKQLHEIESENKELQYKYQQLFDDNQRLRKSLSDIQEYCNTLTEKASKTDTAESEAAIYQSQLREAESQLKRLTHEHQTLLHQKKQEIEELESEFNTQMENTFKEKKILGEKYEKVMEHVSQIEIKLQQYKSNNESLTQSLEELNKVNQELKQQASTKVEASSPDYTEQYISEINNLNAVINNKNQELSDLNNKAQNMQINTAEFVSNLESNIVDLSSKLHDSSIELEMTKKELNNLKHSNAELLESLFGKEEQIKELIEKTKVTFEMNIPKTEGMIISSTIEALNEQPKYVDISNLESQIITDTQLTQPEMNKEVKQQELVKKTIDDSLRSEKQVEPVIVPKQTYLCYSADTETPASDPFNSDEGWGLGEAEEAVDPNLEISLLNEKIQQLTIDKNTLKTDLETSNVKLLKALKKIKELKISNEVLNNELRLAKQMSESSFLDSAIEDELRINNQELEKKIADLNTEIIKEKKEKEFLKKQNEIFNNANDRLTEMKEKLDNEIELWKYKFKEANDKLSTFQWGGDSKDSPLKEHLPTTTREENKYKDEINKIEKENDELQGIVDHLTLQNNELLSEQTKLRNETCNLNMEIKQVQQTCNDLRAELVELQSTNENLLKVKLNLDENVQNIESRYNDIVKNSETEKSNYEASVNVLKEENKVLTNRCSILEEQIQCLNSTDVESKHKIQGLINEIENVKSQLILNEKLNKHEDDIILSELKLQCKNLDEQCNKLSSDLKEANTKVLDLEDVNKDLLEKSKGNNVQIDSFLDEQYNKLSCDLSESNKSILDLENINRDLLEKSKDYNDQIDNLNAKLLHLNTENDNLLSTVAELRASVSSAVDQRGFEIAELWKQHLAQRESDFQHVEQDLRAQIEASEAKYEQLLDSVQSSSQEETNKLVVIEQVTSLQNKLQDKEEHLRDLQNKYVDVMSQLDMLRSEMQDEKITYDNKLLEQQEEYEKVITDMHIKNKEKSESYDHTLLNVEKELVETRAKNDELKLQTNDLLAKIKESEAKFAELTNRLLYQENEIQQKTLEYSLALSHRNEEFENVRQQLLAYEKSIEDLSFEKESELAVLRLKIHEKESDFESIRKEMDYEKSLLIEELNDKITECTKLNKQITELNQTLEDQNGKASQMQIELENQELEIVTLKEDLAEVQNALLASSSKIQKHVSFALDTKPGSEDQPDSGVRQELLDAVPRAELDLALYMLHQRDVRCEELTMELTQLLEERDTLQLRLSDSLRSNEELKSRYHTGLDPSPDSSQETVSELPSFSVEREQQVVDVHRGQTSRSSSISDLDSDKPKLQAKLSELRSVRHSRDVRLRHDSEQRQLGMRLLQRDIAQLPPAAREQLEQAHHTLSRDSQSTPTVLLNWLRGKSTPKVVDM